MTYRAPVGAVAVGCVLAVMVIAALSAWAVVLAWLGAL